MPPSTLSTHQVAETIGVPYTTLLKWQTNDRLLRPALGRGGRRGGDRWSVSEVELARLVARLRAADLPVRYIRTVTEALRASQAGRTEASVYLAVHVRDAGNHSDRRVALLRIEDGGSLRDATQLSCL